LSLLISAKSEMLSISLFADKVRKPAPSINIPCLRHVSVPNSFERLLLKKP
jgi:hypothetical protein